MAIFITVIMFVRFIKGELYFYFKTQKIIMNFIACFKNSFIINLINDQHIYLYRLKIII